MSRPNRSPSPYDFNDFKNWLSKQDTPSLEIKVEEQENELVGKKVSAKSSIRKLRERIEPNDDESPLEELVADFVKNGGTIVSVDGRTCLIESSVGSFYLPKFCLSIDD